VEEATLKLVVSLLKGGFEWYAGILIVTVHFSKTVAAHFSKTEAHGCSLLHKYLLSDIILQIILHCDVLNDGTFIHNLLLCERYNKGSHILL